MQQLQFDYLTIWLFVIFVVSAFASYSLYAASKKAWTNSQNWVLAVIRFCGIFLLMCLLLNPLLKQTIHTIEPPIVAIALDNSESVAAGKTNFETIKKEIAHLRNKLLQNDIETQLFLLDSKNTKTDSIFFTSKTTDLSGLINQVEENMEGKNRVATLLLSDGLYNRGNSPAFQKYLAPVHTIGLGNPVPPKDISITRARFNNIVFKGNNTPIKIEISQKDFLDKKVFVSLTEGNKVLEKKEIVLDNELNEVNFMVPTEEVGLRHLLIVVAPQTGELSTENNISEVFLEVKDEQYSVLLAATTPHPDLSAIANALNTTNNYQVDHFISKMDQVIPEKEYDAVIFHGAFSSNFDLKLKGNPGLWYITGLESSLFLLNNALPFLNIQNQQKKPDHVGGYVNNNFSKYKINENFSLDNFPPISVPFGEYTLTGSVEVLLYQKLANIPTKKPLMVVYENGQIKQAITLGKGIWKWRIHEKAVSGSTENFDELITKTVQYLIIQSEKKKFLFKPQKKVFNAGEKIAFTTESYNDIYEPVYGNPIQLQLFHPNKSISTFDLKTDQNNSVLRVPHQNEGLYHFNATMKIGKNTFTETGGFIVKKINHELVNLIANHRLLQTVSEQSGGKFIEFANMNELTSFILNKTYQSIIKSTEKLYPVKNSYLYYLIIFFLFTAEWFFRKYWGGY